MRIDPEGQLKGQFDVVVYEARVVQGLADEPLLFRPGIEAQTSIPVPS